MWDRRFPGGPVILVLSAQISCYTYDQAKDRDDKTEYIHSCLPFIGSRGAAGSFRPPCADE